MKIPVTLQIVLLTVGLTGFYTMVGQSVPQKEVQPPEIIEIAEDVTTEQMVEIGKGIFVGKGICDTCHTITGQSGALRFPDLATIASTAASRKPGMSALDYLAESLYEPNVFIVDGFSAGMPEINKPPIGLTDQEILSVIAYLQTLGGQATVTMQTKTAYNGGSAEEGGGEALADAGGGTPIEVAGCNRCHDATEPLDPESPSLVGVGSRLDREALFLALANHPPDDALAAATLAELEQMIAQMSEM